ncbi:MAG: SurA N-terminal domain-containing protein, partial [Gemmatimonadales bacterium]|nr:SurA N-terminal domain-containing protein [Gemmatimonadales bacterium]
MISLLACLSLTVGVAALAAQDTTGGAVAQALPRDTTVVVDRVVAVVGNRPVLASQVDEELFSRQAQGIKLPDTPEGLDAVRRQVVSSIIDEELLVQQAARDTAITVTDQEVADGVEQQVRKVRDNFQSEVDYRNELKKAGFQTPEEYRRWLSDQQRRAALQNRLIDKLRTDGKLKPVAPTEEEMKAFFETQKGSLGNR